MHWYIVGGVLVMIGFLLACADRQARHRKAILDRLADRVEAMPEPYVDYSHFDEDQLLRNRSERWE